MTEAEPSAKQYPRDTAQLPADAMRALAHPLRLRILDELSINGPLTASGLGERLAESSGATSYHLRQLEKHGLVREVTAKGNARERWWERRPGSMSTPEPQDFPPGSAERLATQLIENEWNRSREATFHEYIDAYKTTPTAGSRPVQIHLNAFPLVRGDETSEAPGKTSGNVGGREKNS